MSEPTPLTLDELRAAAACPDCNSELGGLWITNGVPNVAVLHDDTCPTWAAIQAADEAEA